MRSWWAVVALAVGLLIELAWPQLPSASVDPGDPDHVIQDATGGSPALTRTGTVVADFFPWAERPK